MEDDVMNIVLFASTHLLEAAQNDSAFRDRILESDLILPADETLLSLHHVDILRAGRMIINYQHFTKAFDSFGKEKRTMFLVGSQEKDVQEYIQHMKQWESGVEIVGTFAADPVAGEEVLINEINTLVPDIVVFLLETPMQENFIMDNKLKFNSKLCLALGSVNIHTIRMQNRYWNPIFRFLLENKGLKKLRAIRLFKKKVEQYNNNKGGNSNGNNE